MAVSNQDATVFIDFEFLSDTLLTSSLINCNTNILHYNVQLQSGLLQSLYTNKFETTLNVLTLNSQFGELTLALVLKKTTYTLYYLMRWQH